MIWFSQRSDWGHLYLYDLTTGQQKRQITSGSWNVTQLLHVDEPARTLYFSAVGREGRDPYFRHAYRVRMEGEGLELLSPADARSRHLAERQLARTSSTPGPRRTPRRWPCCGTRRERKSWRWSGPTSAASSRAGWQPPTRITVKARDGVTELHGLLYKPTRFDPSRKYPIINNIYPGPQTGSVGSRQFAAARSDTQALAELGFIVVQIDGMGTPWRSKRFHEAYYGDMGDNTLPDQVAGMKELASRFPWIDIERAGIYGHSGGGFATAGAMFRYPDFFKVGVSQAGNHDNRNYEDDWGEKWQGLLENQAGGKTNYDNQANQLVAHQLKGKLLLAHGTMDSNVPMYNTLLVVNELIKANKNFDLILFPNRGHGFGNEPYMIRRRWDYFVTHLMGARAPCRLRTAPADGNALSAGDRSEEAETDASTRCRTLIAAVRSAVTYVVVSVYVVIAGILGMAIAVPLKWVGLLYELGHIGVALALGLAGIRYPCPRARARAARSRRRLLLEPSEQRRPAGPLSGLHRRLHILYKAELSKLPILGTAIQVGGFVPVPRDQKEAAMEAIDMAAASIRSGNSFLIFPEGTRSRTEELLPFKKGGFIMAIKAQAPIVPVAISGGRDAMRKGSAIVRPVSSTCESGIPLRRRAIHWRSATLDRPRARTD